MTRRSLALAGAAAAGALGVGARWSAEAQAAGSGTYIVVDAAGGGDYTDFEAAVQAAPAGATIAVRTGTYTVNQGRISPAQGVLITGSGYGTVIRAKDALNANLFQIANDYVVLENLRVDGNGGAQAFRMGNAIMFDSNHGTIRDCFVHDAAGYNIVGFPNAADWVIEGNHSYGTVAGAQYPSEGIELQGTSYCTVANNTVRNIRNNGIYLWNSTGICASNSVTGNVVRACGNSGIEVEDGARDNAIVGNALFDNNWGIWINDLGNSGAASNNLVSGNNVVSSRSSGIQVTTGPNTTIANNIVRGGSANGILLRQASQCTVVGNESIANASHGILIQRSADVLCNSNSVSSNGFTGIDFEDSVDGVCTGNLAYNNGRSSPGYAIGILLHRSGGLCKNHVVTGNRCHDTQAAPTQSIGISLVGAVDNATLADNLVDGSGSTSQAVRVAAAATRVNAVPYRKISVTVNKQQTAIPHGLPYPPLAMSLVMTSAGDVWRSAAADATNIYLTADANNRTAEVLLG